VCFLRIPFFIVLWVEKITEIWNKGFVNMSLVYNGVYTNQVLCLSEVPEQQLEKAF
jgi:hypothetical protein